MQTLEGISVDIEATLIEDVPVALCVLLSDEDVSPCAQDLERVRDFINAAKIGAETMKVDMVEQYRLSEYVPVTYLEVDGRKNCGFVAYSQWQKACQAHVSEKKPSPQRMEVTSLDGGTRTLVKECVQLVENALIATLMFHLRANVTRPGTDCTHYTLFSLSRVYASLMESAMNITSLLRRCCRYGEPDSELATGY